VRWDGDCTIWQFPGVTSKPVCTVKVTPTGDTVDVSNDKAQILSEAK
jgi:hypothetical protein